MRFVDYGVLERRLSVERLGGYRRACGGDLAAALRLYEWNADVSAALGATVGHLEVLLRNALHDQLTVWSTERFQESSWYLDPGGLMSIAAKGDIEAARRRAQRGGAETPGRIVAELNLGFWRFLLASRYDRSLWRTCLYRAFPGQRSRGPVYECVQRLHEARNRVAHHEPMFNRPVAQLRVDALEVAGWICPVSRSWIAEHCRVPDLLRERPDGGQVR